MALRALIFDVDGTLADTERDGHRPAFNAAFAEAGLPWFWDEAFYGTLLGVTGGKERMRHYAQNADPATAQRPDFEALLDRLHELKTVHYQRLLTSGTIRLRPEIGQLICDARTEGLRLAIASSSKRENIVGLLQANLGPQGDTWFEAIASGELKMPKKPAPDLYNWVLERLGVPARDCIAVEDSAHGLAASHAAGIPTVITRGGYTADEDFDDARVVLAGAGDLDLEHLRLWHATAGTG